MLDETGVDEHAGELLATAMALTGSPGPALDLVAGTLARDGGRRKGTDPDPARHRDLLVQRYIARGHIARGHIARGHIARGHIARGHIARGPARASEPESGSRTRDTGLPAELALVAARLDGLSPTQRAVLVLTFRDRVTQSGIAAVLDRSSIRVDRLLSEAVRSIDVAPVEISATLDALARQAPDPTALRPVLRQHQRWQRTRRRRAGTLAGVVAAALVGAVLVPTVVVPRLPAHVRPGQEWSFAFEVQPPPGWTVVARTLTPSEDTALLYRADNDYCQVTTSATPAPVPTKRTRVHGRPGGFTGQPNGNAGLRLVWTYTPGATAEVSCFGRAGQEAVLREIAEGLAFRRVPLLLPLTLTEVPSGYSLQSVSHSPRGSGFQLAQPGTGAFGWVVEFPADSPGGASRSTTVAGRPAEVFADQSRFVLCLKVQGRLTCLNGFDAYGSVLTERRLRALDREGVRIAETLRFAPDTADESTWFDAAVALPH